MKKIALFAMAAFLISGVAFAGDNLDKGKKKGKKSCCKKKSCDKKEEDKTSKTAEM